MIKINLLPPEKRKAESTPLPRLGLLLANLGAVGLVVLGLIVTFLTLYATNNKIRTAEQEIEKLKGAVATHDNLEGQIKKIDAVVRTLETTEKTRPFEWWRVFDSVWDVVQDNSKVWMDSLETMDAKNLEQRLKSADPESKLKPTAGILLKCHSGGIDVKGMTAFRLALKNHPVLQKVFPITNFETQWSAVEEKGFLEQYSLGFDVLMVNTGGPPAPPAKKPGGPAGGAGAK